MLLYKICVYVLIICQKVLQLLQQDE